MANQIQRTQTSTQIRNMYSDGLSYMNIKFFNTNLSFQFYPFLSKDASGKSQYDMKRGQQTTINYEGAYAFYQISKDILEGKIQETGITIPCLGASLTLERKIGMNGFETTFTINKNNTVIPFKFATVQCQCKENGQPVTKIIETGLGVFCHTLKGYLDGINADRHLDKLTEDYAKTQEAKPAQSNNGNYRRPYNNYQNKNNWQSNQSQSFDDYQLQN